VPLADPPPTLDAFPSIPAPSVLYRIHRSSLDPLYFSNTGAGRFDLSAPRGTLYTAETPVGAFLEVFRERLVSSAEVTARSLTTLDPIRELRLADCTHPEARSFGVTAAIHSTPDYALTQRWALAFADAGFDGIEYLVSHDPSASERAVAVFAEAIRSTTSAAIPDDLAAEVQRRFGLLVLPAP
jgi:RES domain-containing protein